MRLIIDSVKKYKYRFLLLVLVLTLEVLIQVVITGYVSRVVDMIVESINASKDMSEIVRLLLVRGGFLLLLALVHALLSVVAGYFCAEIASKTGRDLRSLVYKKVMSFSLKEIDKFSISSLITRSTNDVQGIQSTIHLFLFASLMSPIMAVCGFISVFIYKSKMEWVVAVAIVAVVTSMGGLFIAARKYTLKLQYKLDKVNSIMREQLTGVQVIRAFNKEKWGKERLDNAVDELGYYTLHSDNILLLMMPTFSFISNFVSVIVILVGTMRVSQGLMEVGVLMALVSYVQMIVLSFMLLSAVLMQLPRTLSSAGRIRELLDTPVSIVGGDVKSDPAHENKTVLKFEEVSFKYSEDGKEVLENIDFDIKTGEKLAIIGNTGAGKSTILKLMLRLYDVTKGRILINGEDIRSYETEELRKLFGYVPQNNYLFRGTVESNIAFSSPEHSREDVEEAGKIAQADSFIMDKEDGYSSFVAEGGKNLSGGQRQRLSIARAIMKDPKIYLFDDSFSALDYKTDSELRKALEGKLKNAVTVIVAQRISSVMNADKILVIENGKTVGMGTHEELIKNCEIYKEIARSQMSEEEYHGRAE